MITVKYIKLDSRACVPSYATVSSAGADLRALSNGDIAIPSGATVTIHTGIAVEIPDGYMGLVFARSGIATKRGLAPANKVGVIDSDYRGELMVALHNSSSVEQIIANGERIAQLVIVPHITAEYIEADVLSNTIRGEGGFGSTGKN